MSKINKKPKNIILCKAFRNWIKMDLINLKLIVQIFIKKKQDKKSFNEYKVNLE